jgi:hypothetical protein
VPYAVIPLALVLVCLWLGRRLLTLVVIFGYLSIEGTLKLLSGGNPIVHVGIDIIVLSVAVYWLMEAVITRQAGLPNVPWIRTVALFVVWVVALVFHPLSAGLYVSIASFKMHLTMIPLYLMTAAVVRTREDITRLLIALTVIALIPFVAALAQYALGPSSVLDVAAPRSGRCWRCRRRSRWSAPRRCRGGPACSRCWPSRARPAPSPCPACAPW